MKTVIWNQVYSILSVRNARDPFHKPYYRIAPWRNELKGTLTAYIKLQNY